MVSKENLDLALDKYEAEYERIRQGIERIIDRTERNLKIYLIVTSILVTGVSFGSLDLPTNLILQLMMLVGLLSINGAYLWRTFEILKPTEVKRVDYDLDNSDSTISKNVINKKEKSMRVHTIRGFDKLNKWNKDKLLDISEKFESTYKVFLIALVSNIAVVLTLAIVS